MRIPKHNEKKKNKKTATCVNDEGVLTGKREQLFILTRKCFDVKFLADTFGICPKNCHFQSHGLLDQK